MAKLEEGSPIGDFVRPKNKFESQGESIQDSCKTCNTVMYGAETWAVKKAQEKKLDVAEMRMLRWMSGVTKLDRTRNERIIVLGPEAKFSEIGTTRRDKGSYGFLLGICM